MTVFKRRERRRNRKRKRKKTWWKWNWNGFENGRADNCRVVGSQRLKMQLFILYTTLPEVMVLGKQQRGNHGHDDDNNNKPLSVRLTFLTGWDDWSPPPHPFDLTGPDQSESTESSNVSTALGPVNEMGSMLVGFLGQQHLTGQRVPLYIHQQPTAKFSEWVV